LIRAVPIPLILIEKVGESFTQKVTFVNIIENVPDLFHVLSLFRANTHRPLVF
jgi:hypothetical protein